jgi:hypothetical protein
MTTGRINQVAIEWRASERALGGNLYHLALLLLLPGLSGVRVAPLVARVDGSVERRP